MASNPYLAPPAISSNELLVSTQVYDFVDLISEGPIYGFVDKSGKMATGTAGGFPAELKGFYYDDVPVMDSASNGLNFQKLKFDYQLGDESQSPLEIPNNISREKIYSAELIGPWDWGDQQTLDTRWVNTANYNFGQWNSPIHTSNVGPAQVPTSDAVPVIHEIENYWVNKARINLKINSLAYILHTDPTAANVGRQQATYLDFDIVVGVRDKNGKLVRSETSYYVYVWGLVNQSPYGYSREIELPDREEGQSAYINITRRTPETLSPVIQRKVMLDSVVEVVNKYPMSYPFSTVVGQTIDARTFRNPPQRSFHIRGKMVRIPSNYYPLQTEEDATLIASGRPQKLQTMDWRRYANNETYATHTNGTEDPIDTDAYPPAQIYQGSWDGSFKWSWTDNPVWILYDLLINNVYGLGNFVQAELIDKWTLYEIGRFCDAVDDAGYFVGVPTLEGGLEPRYSCNIIVENEQEAYELLNYIAGIFRGIVYWQNGGFGFSDDRPKDPVMYFGNADVKDGVFNYSDTIKNGRFTVVEVAYNDRDDRFLPKIEYVEDVDGILAYGVIKNSIQGFGITSRSEARRLGLYQIYSSKFEPELLSFYANQKASYLRPGDVVGISDDLRQINRFNGVIKDKSISGDYLNLNLDAPIPDTIVSGSNIVVTLPWGYNTKDVLDSKTGVSRLDVDNMRTKQYVSLPIQIVDDTRTIVSVSGVDFPVYNGTIPTAGDLVANPSASYESIDISEAYNYIPPYSLFVATETGKEPDYYRIVGIKENNPSEYEVTAVEYNANKFDAVENEALGTDFTNEDFFEDIFSTIKKPNAPTSLTFSKANENGSLFDISGSWTAPSTPPNLASGPPNDQYPYKATLFYPNGNTSTQVAENTNILFENLTGTGSYSMYVWSIGEGPNYLVSSPAIYTNTVALNQSEYTYSGVTVTGMSLNNSIENNFSEADFSGTGINSDAALSVQWSLALPDATILSGSNNVSATAFDIKQNIKIYDAGFSEKSGLSLSNYKSTTMTVTQSQLTSSFGYYPRDFYVGVFVSGENAPSSAISSGVYRVRKPEITITGVSVSDKNGTHLWDATSSIQTSPTSVSGEITFDIYVSGTGAGDLQAMSVYSGASLPVTINDDHLLGRLALNGASGTGTSISFIDEFLDVSGNILADPFYFAFLGEDSVSTGHLFSGTGVNGEYTNDQFEEYVTDIYNQLEALDERYLNGLENTNPIHLFDDMWNSGNWTEYDSTSGALIQMGGRSEINGGGILSIQPSQDSGYQTARIKLNEDGSGKNIAYGNWSGVKAVTRFYPNVVSSSPQSFFVGFTDSSGISTSSGALFASGAKYVGVVYSSETGAGKAIPLRANSTSYSEGDMVVVSGKELVYRANNAGTSNVAPPTFPDKFGNNVSDGTVTWVAHSVATNGNLYGINYELGNPNSLNYYSSSFDLPSSNKENVKLTIDIGTGNDCVITAAGQQNNNGGAAYSGSGQIATFTTNSSFTNKSFSYMVDKNIYLDIDYMGIYSDSIR